MPSFAPWRLDVSTAAVWGLIVLAVVAANLPFLSQKLFCVWLPKGHVSKSVGLHLIELAVFYAIVGGIGAAIEHNAGQIAPQKWEFYAVTVCLFVTLAFPGFVWRFLLKHPHASAHPQAPAHPQP